MLSASQTVIFAPSLSGAGNLPCETQRHTVAGLTGSRPAALLVVAKSRILKKRRAISFASRIASQRQGDGTSPNKTP